jgi:PPP family 3-phenylpropionic acid transporter
MLSTSLYWRLSAFYFFFFGALGALVPYWGPYLKALGFSAAEIGELMALLAASRIIAPNLWGWVADHYGRRMPIVRLTAFLTIVCFVGVFVDHSYWWLALVMSAFSFFWNASLPQFESNTLLHLGKHINRYSRLRLWGSIGFIVTVMSIGQALQSFDVILIVPLSLAILFTGIWLSSLTVPEYPLPPEDHAPVSLLKVLRQPVVIALLLGCFLMQASHGVYYAFYSIYLREADYSPLWVSSLWSLGVVAEIGVFWIMHTLMHRFAAATLLLVSLLLAALRWVVIGAFVDNALLLIFGQLLHAASFGVYHAASIHLIHQHFRGKLQVRGQALYSSLSFGAGNALGTLISGYTWDLWGPQTTFNLAALMALLGFAIGWLWLQQDN